MSIDTQTRADLRQVIGRLVVENGQLRERMRALESELKASQRAILSYEPFVPPAGHTCGVLGACDHDRG
jgi:hypothetical protein